MKRELQIVADENIPLCKELFRSLGKIRILPGRAISRADLLDTDVLLVRSITRVDKDLLTGTRVGFVGSATIGTDHIDTGYLRSRDISFAFAPGCNARAVGEYVSGVILEWSRSRNRSPEDLQVGIVGAGNTGSEAARLLAALGIQCHLCDPPLSAAADPRELVSFQALRQMDVISFHVPLERSGPWPTWHLADKDLLTGMTRRQLLVNASRGAVVDNRALRELAEQGRGPEFALDVWEQEPAIDADLLACAWLGTPHIAGYSVEGKVRGSFALYRQFCQWLQVPVQSSLNDWIGEQSRSALDDPDRLKAALTELGDRLRADEADLRRAKPPLAAHFDRLRSQYPPRHEVTA